MAKGTNSVEESSDFLVKYKNETFDLHKFLHKHPGGVRTLASLRGCDLTKLMSQDPMHSRAAFYLMQEYKVNADSVAKQMKNNGSENYTTQNNGHPNSLRANGTHGSNQTVDEDYSNQDKATNPAPGVHPYRGNGDGRLEVQTCDKSSRDQLTNLVKHTALIIRGHLTESLSEIAITQ